MKSYREELWFETKTRRAYLNITQQVEAAVRKSGVQEGLVLVNAMHITASVYINDDEPGLLKDYDRFLETLVPQGATYRHNETGEDNGDARRRDYRRPTGLRSVGANLLWGVRWHETEACVGEGDRGVSGMSCTQQRGPCGNKLLERLLPQGKFGNMDRSHARLYDRSMCLC